MDKPTIALSKVKGVAPSQAQLCANDDKPRVAKSKGDSTEESRDIPHKEKAGSSHMKLCVNKDISKLAHPTTNTAVPDQAPYCNGSMLPKNAQSGGGEEDSGSQAPQASDERPRQTELCKGSEGS